MSLHRNSNPVCLQFYLPKSEKELFYRAVWLSDSTMSRELRRMIRAYIQDKCDVLASDPRNIDIYRNSFPGQFMSASTGNDTSTTD